MVSQPLALVLATAAVSMARTPTGFTPGSNVDLIVEFNNVAALNGAVVSKETSSTQPSIGTTTRLTGTQFAVIMIDLDIPTNNPPQTNTLLHWMQTGLTQASTATMLNTTSGSQMVFLLENRGNTAAPAPYIGPSPPARVPLSHRYTQILVDTSGITTDATNTLQTAAQTRQGFNAQQILSSAGLQSKVVAGNSFNVTNPGPAQSGGGGGNGGASSTSGGFTPTSTGPVTTSTFVTAAGSVGEPGFAIFGLLMAGAIFLGL